MKCLSDKANLLVLLQKKKTYMYSNDINSLLAYVCELNSFSL